MWHFRQSSPFAPGFNLKFSRGAADATAAREQTASISRAVPYRKFIASPLFLDDMAFLAVPSGKRRMNHLVEEFRIFRGMGRMAGHAIHLRGLDPDMRLAEGFLPEVMAFPAQRFHRFGKQRMFS
jgi:hypothetical protein